MRLIYLVGMLTALVMFLSVVELSRRNILERDTFFIGLSLSLGLGFVSLMPEVIRFLSSLLGLTYTYVFTSTAGILGLLVLNIYTLAKLSKTRRRLNELSQEVALRELD